MPEPSPFQAERERLRQIYAGYDAAGAHRWAPEQPGNQCIARERQARLRALLTAPGQPPLASRRILELGCERGTLLASFRALGADPGALVAIDIRPDVVAIARAHFPVSRFLVADAVALPFPDRCFDLVIAATLFSSLLSARARLAAAKEIERVLTPGGALLWYDLRYDNPRNPNVHGLRARDVRRLFPHLHGSLCSLTVCPPLARRLGPLTRALYPALSALPPLRTHLLGLLEKR